MKNIRYFAVMMIYVLVSSWSRGQNAAAPNAQPSSVLFHNARVFDGVKEVVPGPADVLVQGNKIAKISSTPIHPDADTKVIDGTGRTLMPGLIDAHYHIMLASLPMQVALTADLGYINLAAASADGKRGYFHEKQESPAARRRLKPNSLHAPKPGIV